MNIKEINIKSLTVENVDMRDYPDFCDAFFSYAETVDGRELSDAELESLTLDNPTRSGSSASDPLLEGHAIAPCNQSKKSLR